MILSLGNRESFHPLFPIISSLYDPFLSVLDAVIMSARRATPAAPVSAADPAQEAVPDPHTVPGGDDDPASASSAGTDSSAGPDEDAKVVDITSNKPDAAPSAGYVDVFRQCCDVSAYNAISHILVQNEKAPKGTALNAFIPRSRS